MHKGESMETDQTVSERIGESDTLSRSRMANSCSLHSQPLNGGCLSNYNSNQSPIFAIQGKSYTNIKFFFPNIKFWQLCTMKLTNL